MFSTTVFSNGRICLFYCNFVGYDYQKYLLHIIVFVKSLTKNISKISYKTLQ